MERSKSGRSTYANIGVWRENDSIHLTIKGMKGAHIRVNADPTKRNGHPTLYARLEQLLEADLPPPPDSLQVVFVSPDGTKRAGPSFKIG